MAASTRTYAQYTSDTKPYSPTDTVTLADTTAVLEGLSPSAIAELSSDNVDGINSTNDILHLTVDQYRALGSVALDPSDLVLIRDSGANIASLTSAEFGGLEAKGVAIITASDGALTLDTAQYFALGAVSL